jgi:hypothetical protein
MKHAWRTLAIFFMALLLADQVSTALLNAAKRQHLAHLEHGAWWPKSYPALELWELCVYVVLFGLLGAVLSLLLKQRKFAVTLAGLLGLGFSAIAFVVEPDLPFARYSHAPAWLWVLSWSALYAPTLACVLGALLAGKATSHPHRAEHAALYLPEEGS